MPEVNLPIPAMGKNTDETVQNLFDTVSKLRKELEWLLYNLDSKNVLESLTAKTAVIGQLEAETIEAQNITTVNGKITTAQIENLVVGSNVTMGANAEILWESIDGKPDTTHIDGNGIYTGTLTAQQINAIQGIILGANASISWEDLPDLPSVAQIGAKAYDWLPSYGDISGTKPPADADKTVDVIGANRLTYVDQNGIYTGTLTAQQINAIQGIVLGANATIQWANLPSLPTASQVGARASDWIPSRNDLGSWTTYIDANGIYTGTINADNINAGTLQTANWDGSGTNFIAMQRQMMYFQEGELTKMAIGFLADHTNTLTPLLVLGAGDGNGNNRGYISKGATGLNLFYVGNLAGQEVTGISIKNGSIETTCEIIVNAGLANQFTLDAQSWNDKLTEVDITNPSKNYNIPIENLDSTTASKINSGHSAFEYFVDGRLYSDRIHDGAITTAKIANASVDVNKLANLSVTASKISDGSITFSKLGDASVGTQKIADLAITGTKIALASIGTAHIETGAITNALIANASIDTAKIADASITGAKIAEASIGSASIASGAIGTAHIGNGVITLAHIAEGVIEQAQIGDLDAGIITAGTLTTQSWDGTGNNYIAMQRQMLYFQENTSTKMALGFLPNHNNVLTPLIALGAGDGYGNNRAYISKGTDGLNLFYIGNLAGQEVTGMSIKNNTIQTTCPITMYAGLANEFILDAESWNEKLTEVDMTSIISNPLKTLDIPMENFDSSTRMKVNNGYEAYSYFDLGLLHTSRLADAVITTEKLANSAVNTVKLANLSVIASKIADSAVTFDKISDGAVNTQKLADASITTAKIANSSIDVNKLADLAVTASKIYDGSISFAKLGDASVGTQKIQSQAVTGTKIALASIGTAHIENGAITNALIENASIDTAKIADASITSAKIANLAVGSAAIAAAAIGTAHIANAAITTANIANAAITSALIANLAVGSEAIQSSAIGTAHIANGVITNAHIQDATISSAKIQSITADKISVGTLTGFTVRTAGSGNNRIVLSGSSFYGADSDDFYHGLKMDAGTLDLIIYSHGTEFFKIYNNIGSMTLKAYGDDILSYNDTVNKTYPNGVWDFSSCTVTGLDESEANYKVMCSATDSTPDFLDGKLSYHADRISLSINNTGQDESVVIGIPDLAKLGDIWLGGISKSHIDGNGQTVSDTAGNFSITSEFIPWSDDTKLMIQSHHATQEYTILEIMSPDNASTAREATVAVHVVEGSNDYFGDFSLLTYQDDPRMVTVAQSRGAVPPWWGVLISTNYFNEGGATILEGFRFTRTGEAKGETHWQRKSNTHINQLRFGDYSSMVERLAAADSNYASYRRFAIMYNAFCSDYTNNLYQQYTPWVDSYKFEIDGTTVDSSAGGGFKFFARPTLDWGKYEHNDSEWVLCMNLHKNGMAFGSGDFYISHGYGTADLYIGKAEKTTKLLGTHDFTNATLSGGLKKIHVGTTPPEDTTMLWLDTN